MTLGPPDCDWERRAEEASLAPDERAALTDEASPTKLVDGHPPGRHGEVEVLRVPETSHHALAERDLGAGPWLMA